jgi:ANTAR domain
MTAEVSDRSVSLAERAAAARLKAEANVVRVRDTLARLNDTKQQLRTDRTGRQRQHESAYARLTARLETLPVIEQAKGILVAQTGCGPDEAFRLLRLASQRSNVKIRDLAADIVARAAAGRPVMNGHQTDRPRRPGATRG